MADSPTRNPFASSVVLRVPGAQAVDVTRDRPWAGASRLFDLYRPPDARGPLPAVVFVTGFADLGFRTIAGHAFEDTARFSSWARLGAPPRDPDGAGRTEMTAPPRPPATGLRRGHCSPIAARQLRRADPARSAVATAPTPATART